MCVNKGWAGSKYNLFLGRGPPADGQLQTEFTDIWGGGPYQLTEPVFTPSQARYTLSASAGSYVLHALCAANHTARIELTGGAAGVKAVVTAGPENGTLTGGQEKRRERTPLNTLPATITLECVVKPSLVPDSACLYHHRPHLAAGCCARLLARHRCVVHMLQHRPVPGRSVLVQAGQHKHRRCRGPATSRTTGERLPRARQLYIVSTCVEQLRCINMYH